MCRMLPQRIGLALPGAIVVRSEKITCETLMVVLGQEDEYVVLEANTDATVLLLSGAPIIGLGSVVMNTQPRISAGHGRVHQRQVQARIC